MAVLDLLVSACEFSPVSPPPTAVLITKSDQPVSETNTPFPTRLAATGTAEIVLSPTAPPLPSLTIPPTLAETATSTPNSFRPVITVEELLPGNFRNFVMSADGTLWMATDEGVAKLVDDTWTTYLSDIPGDLAGIDTSGRVWVTSEDTSRISAWNGAHWITYGVEAGWTPLADSYFQFMRGGELDARGRIWFSTPGGVRALDGDRWLSYTLEDLSMPVPEPDGPETVLSVAIVQNGMVWVSGCNWGGPGPFGGPGVRWFDGKSWQGKEAPVASGCATAIAEDHAGHIWFGVESSLWRFDPSDGGWVEFPAPEPPISDMRFGFVDNIAVDPSGDPWVVLVLCGGASCYGNSVLYHFHDGVWTQIGEVADYDVGFWGPVFDALGVPWIYWTGGIYRIIDDVPELVSPMMGGAGARDQRGRLWITTWLDSGVMLWVYEGEE